MARIEEEREEEGEVEWRKIIHASKELTEMLGIKFITHLLFTTAFVY